MSKVRPSRVMSGIKAGEWHLNWISKTNQKAEFNLNMHNLKCQQQHYQQLNQIALHNNEFRLGFPWKPNELKGNRQTNSVHRLWKSTGASISAAPYNYLLALNIYLKLETGKSASHSSTGPLIRPPLKLGLVSQIKS